MISIHPNIRDLTRDKDWIYTAGFDWAETSFDDLPRLITRRAWSPIRFRDGYRKGDNFEVAYVVALDFDNGKCTLDEALRRFHCYAHIIGTTRSHQLEKDGKPATDRFRVILKLAAPIGTMGMFKSTLKHLVKHDHPESDQKPKDAGRFFYPCKEVVSVKLDGDLVTPIPEPPPRPPRDYTLEKQFKNIPKWVRSFLKFGAPEGSRNDTSLRISKALTKCGFSYDEIYDLLSKSNMNLPSDEMSRVVQNGRNYGKASS